MAISKKMSAPAPRPPNSAGSFARQMAFATELPFLLVGGVAGGAFLGYLLDRWLHTKPYLALRDGRCWIFLWGFAIC